MAIEKEIIARMFDAISAGNYGQEKLYANFLSDLRFRESQGMQDSEKPLSQASQSNFVPILDDPLHKQVVQKANPVCGTFDDEVAISDLIRTPAWNQMDRTLSPFERAVLNRAFYGVARRAQLTLGLIRASTVEELSASVRNVGVKTAILLINVVKPVHTD